MYQRPASPLSIGGVLDDGFRLFKASFSRLFPLALIPALLSQIPSVVTGAGPEVPVVPPRSAIILMIVTSLITLIFYGASVARVHALAQGGDLSFGDSLAVGGRRFLSMLGCVLVFVFIFLGSSLLLVIPGLIVLVLLLFGPYLVITDGLGPGDALEQSRKLVWGHWWRTAAILTVITCVMAAAYGVIGFGAGFLAAVLGATSGMTWNLLNLVVIPLLAALVNPIGYAFSMSMLNDLKLRREGDDLAQRMEGLETT